MFYLKNIFGIFYLLFATSLAKAAALGTIPTVDQGRPRFIIDTRTDLWLRPSQDKLEPVRIYENEFKVPLYRNQDWVASFNAQFDGLSFGRTDLRVGHEQVTLGTSLRSQSAGFGLRHQLDINSSLSGFVSYRSASDEPFKNPRDQWLEISFLYFSSKSESGLQWILLSNQSHNRGFNNGQWFPFIGVQIDVDPEFSYSVGLPFLRLAWKKPLGFAAVITATPTGASGVISQRISENFLALSHFGVAVHSFLHSKRTLSEDRAFYEEKYADLGFKYFLSKDTDISLAVGGSFDRYVYGGKTAFKADSSKNRLTNDFYGRLVLDFHL